MTIYICGVSHKTAHVTFRERIYLANATLHGVLKSIVDSPDIHEIMVLSTCNRTEFYCIASNKNAIQRWFQDYYQLTAEEFDNHAYLYEGQKAIEHIIQVACGLDSLVLGEPQIFGQVKEAFNTAHTLGFIGPRLFQLFQFVCTITKKIRHETAIGQQPVSIASAAVNLAKYIFTNLAEINLLVIGAGDTAQLAAEHFYKNKVKNIIIANRTLKNAQLLAKQLGGESVLLADISTHLAKCDIIVTATASPDCILTKEMIEPARKLGQKRPLFIVDIAVPRNAEENIAEIEGVYLYNIDDLKKIAEEGITQRQQAANQAGLIIQSAVAHYVKQQEGKKYVDTVRLYRNKIEQLKEKELSKAIRALKEGQSAEKVISMMAHSLTNKLMHHPSLLLRTAGISNNNDFLEVAKRIFELEE